ncbi:DHBP synthase RibB-like alpha/beta domain-containing protein [Cunninghamella echinulata]|nr:DHBP synthase RibB-like alpha/beta domain-containing protein [Cunninghamella echinulata]
MKTEVIKVDLSHFQFKEKVGGLFNGQNATPLITSTHDKEAIDKAVYWLKQGEAIGIPTETVYGLAANALNENAVSKIFTAKNRPQDNPLIVHISSLSMLESILPDGKIPPIYLPIIQQCWPGPLTIIVPTSSLIPTSVTCGQPTVAVRFPSHPVARALIDACGFPLAAPSANSSGKPSPTLASHVFDDLNHKIPLILDGGLCNVGLESTVLDGLRTPPAILRPGGATYEMLKSIEGMNGLQVYKKHFVDQALELAPTTPGMKYRHYSPEAMVILIVEKEPLSSAIATTNENNKNSNTFDLVWKKELKHLLGSGIGIKKVGILKTVNDKSMDYEWRTNIMEDEIEYVTLQMGRHDHPEEVARGMFKGLRELDSTIVDVIFVQGVSETKEGMAIMNRLHKAASKTITL